MDIDSNLSGENVQVGFFFDVPMMGEPELMRRPQRNGLMNLSDQHTQSGLPWLFRFALGFYQQSRTIYTVHAGSAGMKAYGITLIEERESTS